MILYGMVGPVVLPPSGQGGNAPLVIDVPPPEIYVVRHLPGASNACAYELIFHQGIAELAPEQIRPICSQAIRELWRQRMQLKRGSEFIAKGNMDHGCSGIEEIYIGIRPLINKTGGAKSVPPAERALQHGRAAKTIATVATDFIENGVQFVK